MSGSLAGSAFQRTLARVSWASASKLWDDAADLWEAVVAANPVDATFWTRLGDACHHVERYSRAIAAFQRALELGQLPYQSNSDVSSYGFPSDIAYAVARCHARAGDHGRALEWLARAFDLSDLYRQTSWSMDTRTWIAPLIFTPPTFAAFRENRDPALEVILDLCEHLPGM